MRHTASCGGILPTSPLAGSELLLTQWYSASPELMYGRSVCIPGNDSKSVGVFKHNSAHGQLQGRVALSNLNSASQQMGRHYRQSDQRRSRSMSQGIPLQQYWTLRAVTWFSGGLLPMSKTYMRPTPMRACHSSHSGISRA